MFKTAFNRLPACIGGFDAFNHKTVEDLGWLVLLEVDLYHEGEETDIRNRRDYKACQNYLTWLRAKGYDIPK